MSLREQIRKALLIACNQRDNGNRKTHASHVDFNEGRISAYEHCLELFTEYEKVESKAKSDFEAAAVAVIDLERDRVNAGGGEPYDPIANPGYFDPRVVDLAKFVWVQEDVAAAFVTPCHKITSLAGSADTETRCSRLRQASQRSAWRSILGLSIEGFSLDRILA